MAVLGACGGGSATGSSANYKDSFRAALAVYQEATTDAQKKAKAASGGSLNAKVDAYRAIRDAAVQGRDAFAELKPPTEAADSHTRLVSLLSDQIDALDDVIAAAEKGDADRVTTSLQRLAELTQQWLRTKNQLQIDLGMTA